MSYNTSRPAVEAIPIAPHDTNFIRADEEAVRSLYVGVSGDVAVLLVGNESPVTFTNVPVGILPVQALKVLSTGTDAAGIIGLV